MTLTQLWYLSLTTGWLLLFVMFIVESRGTMFRVPNKFWILYSLAFAGVSFYGLIH